jgi:hypothetical protein
MEGGFPLEKKEKKGWRARVRLASMHFQFTQQLFHSVRKR